MAEIEIAKFQRQSVEAANKDVMEFLRGCVQGYCAIPRDCARDGFDAIVESHRQRGLPLPSVSFEYAWHQVTLGAAQPDFKESR